MGKYDDIISLPHHESAKLRIRPIFYIMDISNFFISTFRHNSLLISQKMPDLNIITFLLSYYLASSTTLFLLWTW